MDSMVDHKTSSLVVKVVAKCFSVRKVKVTGFMNVTIFNNKGSTVIITEYNHLP